MKIAIRQGKNENNIYEMKLVKRSRTLRGLFMTRGPLRDYTGHNWFYRQEMEWQIKAKERIKTGRGKKVSGRQGLLKYTEWSEIWFLKKEEKIWLTAEDLDMKCQQLD